MPRLIALLAASLLLTLPGCSPRPAPEAAVEDAAGEAPGTEARPGDRGTTDDEATGDDAEGSEQKAGARGTAAVSGIELMVLKSFPLQVRATLSGDLADACTRVAEVEQAREGNTFRLTVRTERPPEAMCAQVITPFTETVSLDVVGLPAGTYTVVAGEASSSFTFDRDNELRGRPQAGP